MKKLKIGTFIKYNGDIYRITKYDEIGYYVKVINPSDNEYATHISYNAPIQVEDYKELNLCELLKDYENEIFYNPLLGNVTVTPSSNGKLLHIHQGGFTVDISSNGTDSDGNMALFPSREQRDWLEWKESKKLETPKTWSELVYANKVSMRECNLFCLNKDYEEYTPIEKSIIALFKIHKLIEISYGGNVHEDAWNDGNYGAWCILYDYKENKFKIQHSVYLMQHLAFQRLKQAEEFLSYPENVQLLKDYYMI